MTRRPRCARALPFLLLALAAPAAAQTVQATYGVAQFGRPVEPRTHHVVLGANNGQDATAGLRLEAAVAGAVSAAAELWAVSTYVLSWPCDSTPCEALPRTYNPPPGESWPVTVSGVDLELLWRPLGWVGVGGGAGVTAISGRYYDLGALPLYSIGLVAQLQLCYPAALLLCARAKRTLVAPRRGRFTALADRAERPRPDTADHGEEWFPIDHLEVAFGVRW